MYIPRGIVCIIYAQSRPAGLRGQVPHYSVAIKQQAMIITRIGRCLGRCVSTASAVTACFFSECVLGLDVVTTIVLQMCKLASI